MIALEIEHLSVRYGRTVALDDVCLRVASGEIVALVGPSGGGKTTIFNLLLRFYNPDEGEITIDGQSIAALSQASVRGNIAYVGQDIFLFRGSRKFLQKG